MGFSFRSLYTDDDHPISGGTAGVLPHETSGRPSRANPRIPSQDLPSPPSRRAPSGIPGPLSATAPLQNFVPSSIDSPRQTRPSSSSAFDSLDSLEAERSRPLTAAPAPLDELPARAAEEPVSLDNSSRNSKPCNASDDEQGREAQTQLRAVFSVSGSFTLETIAVLTAKLPGVSSCIIQNSAHSLLASADSEKIQRIELTEITLRNEALQQSFNLLGLDQVEGVLLRSTSGSATCFSCSDLSLMARHPDENLEPGLWEKLLLITQASAKLKPGI